MYDRPVPDHADGQGRATLPEAIDAASILGREGDAKPVLVVLTGAQLGQRIRLEQPAILGRDPEADLMLTDGSIGWHHARVVPRGEAWVVLAESPEHPVAVNGEPVGERALAPEDQIHLGGVVVRFELHDPVEQAYDEAVLERLNTDELTGLPARRKFDARLSAMLIAAARHTEPVAVIVLDVDRLKEINDRDGHLAGAAVIAAVGRVLRDGLPEGSLACRLGGDEFAVAMRGVAPEQAVDVAEALRVAVAALRVGHEGRVLEARVSIGVASFPRDADMANRLLRRADEAMYGAKRAGGDRVAVASA